MSGWEVRRRASVATPEVGSKRTPAFSNRKLSTLRRRPTATSTSSASIRLRNVESLRSEEHTSELQSRSDIVCRLLLEKKTTKKMRWVSSTAKCVALTRVAAAIWSGRDAMMSRIPPRSTCATARGSNIGGLMGPLKISPPPLRVKTNKVVPTTILIYAAQLLRIRGSRTRGGRPAARRIHPRVRRRWPRRGNGPHDCQRVRDAGIHPHASQGGGGSDLHDPLGRSPCANRPPVHGGRPPAIRVRVPGPPGDLQGRHEIRSAQRLLDLRQSPRHLHRRDGCGPGQDDLAIRGDREGSDETGERMGGPRLRG